ncbi:rhamnogalacturonan acetylesterase [Hymenobacter chitinivorans]|uniref:Lysophospholipase L1-like esterase n=1 Tax=Hymenobacter chitinivorans DSM 11115 TaxID=1121954 RepID=A0A2M9BPR6_9BACT|nr:rhamnogalacturonan acetylesterase [Hymenobacter chitinivorans]PJJ59917.1 lysophospholipase L1-like esterase [Hymenobacter chitinivorans DSM 11115]
MKHPLVFRFGLLAALALSTLLLAFGKGPKRPTLYLIGDSTVRNTNAPQMGWGTQLPAFFDTARINIDNRAMAGRSTRTFVSEKRWRVVDSLLRPGDFLLMQFGHNEGSAPDTTKAGRRGVLPGTGEETKQLIWPNGRPETVHTYGWYLRQFIRQAKAKGVTPLVASMIPRNQWQDGKVKRATQNFGGWAREVARQENVAFIDLNQLTADKYDRLGPEAVAKLFAGDHTHTNEAGALLNAASVVEGIRANRKIALNKYLAKQQ